MSSDLPASGDLPTTITLRSPADLIAMAPYLIGYVPDRRLIIAGIGGTTGETTGSIRVTSTVEIPPPGTGQTVLAGIAGDMVRQVRNASADAVYVLAFGEGHAATRLVDAVRAELAIQGVAVRMALRIHGGRYWIYTGINRDGADRADGVSGGVADHCPIEGIPVDPAGSHVAAQAAMAGEAPFSSRSAVAETIAPVQGEARAAMRAATGVAEELLNGARTLAPERAGDDLRDASCRFLPCAAERYASGGVLDDVQAATLAIALGDGRVRDRAICLAAHGNTSAYLNMWADLARRVEPAYRVPVLVLLAFTAWRDGGGPLPSIAIDEALTADPGHPFAQVMREALAHGIPATDIDIPEPGELPGT